jgi:transcriptional regulator GlxA family with amidase domain
VFQSAAPRVRRSNLADNALRVAFLVDDSSAVIDFAGPWEVFQRMLINDRAMCDLYLVSPDGGTVRTGGGFQVVADYSIDAAPAPDVLVIGAQGMQTEQSYTRKLAWIQRIEPSAQVILAVCTGALTLAGTGLLDGLSATTHPIAYDRFIAEYPQVTLVRDARFIDHGKVMTTGGENAGIDGALHVCARLFGVAAAEAAAEYMQYQSSCARVGRGGSTRRDGASSLAPGFIQPKRLKPRLSAAAGSASLAKLGRSSS